MEVEIVDESIVVVNGSSRFHSMDDKAVAVDVWSLGWFKEVFKSTKRYRTWETCIHFSYSMVWRWLRGSSHEYHCWLVSPCCLWLMGDLQKKRLNVDIDYRITPFVAIFGQHDVRQRRGILGVMNESSRVFSIVLSSDTDVFDATTAGWRSFSLDTARLSNG